MAQEEKAKITVTATHKILKFAEGVEPIEGNEFEVVEKEEVYVGEEAERLLREMGVKTNATN
jgi:hypothetical protein